MVEITLAEEKRRADVTLRDLRQPNLIRQP
jgi:hypothetical protein